MNWLKLKLLEFNYRSKVSSKVVGFGEDVKTWKIQTGLEAKPHVLWNGIAGVYKKTISSHSIGENCTDVIQYASQGRVYDDLFNRAERYYLSIIIKCRLRELKVISDAKREMRRVTDMERLL